MSYNHSVIVVCPDAVKESLLGMGRMLPSPVDGGMDVALSPTGSEPVTHWASHSWAQQDFVRIIQGQIIPSVEGVSVEQIQALLASITVSVDAVDENGAALRPVQHLQSVLDNLGLQKVVADIA